MSGFLNKILPAAGIAVGAGVLGSYLFPETMGSMSGGLLGSNPIGTNPDGTTMFEPSTSAFSIGDLFGGSSSAKGSMWTDPTVLSSGIIAGTSLLQGLFGQQPGDMTMKDQATLDEEKRQFDASMALKEKDLAQALEIARIQAGAAGAGAGATVRAAGIASDSARRQAKANMINDSVTTQANALQIPLAARSKQMEAAQNTGVQSGIFFNSLIPNLQRPLLRGA